MGLRSTIQNAVNSAFSAMGDIPISITYTQVSNGGYDANTGSTTETTTSLSLTAIITSYDQERINAGISLATDQQMLLPGKDLSITPKPQDRVTFDNFTYEVYQVERDPTSALYKIQLRRK